jgi:hypothetical protein
MAFKKIRKSEMTFSSIAITMVLVLAIFFGLFQYWNYNLTNSGQTMNSTYNDLNTQLVASQEEMDTNVGDIKTNLAKVIEPEVGVFAVAINGLKGLKNVFALFVNSLDMYSTIIQSFIDVSGLPQWMKTIIVLGLITLILLLIVAIFAGATNKISH